MKDKWKTCSKYTGRGSFQGTGQEEVDDGKSFSIWVKHPEKAEIGIKSYSCSEKGRVHGMSLKPQALCTCQLLTCCAVSCIRTLWVQGTQINLNVWRKNVDFISPQTQTMEKVGWSSAGGGAGLRTSPAMRMLSFFRVCFSLRIAFTLSRADSLNDRRCDLGPFQAYILTACY